MNLFKRIKNKLFASVLFLSVLCFTGCDADLLNTSPQNQYNVGNFWESEAAIDAALAGAYRPLRYQGIFGRQASPAWEDAATPNLFTTSGIGFNFIAFGEQTAHSGNVMTWRWNHAYNGIGRTNIFLPPI